MTNKKNLSHCDLPLQDQTVANLIILTAFRLELIADRKIFKPLGITAASFRILAVLSRLGPVSPGEVVDLLGASKSNLTQRFNFLTRAGLVEKEGGSQADRRKIIMRLTAAGERKVKEVYLIMKKANLYVEKSFNTKDLDFFRSFMERLNQKITQESVAHH